MAAINGLRYPLLTDNPDIPEDIKFLASDIGGKLLRVVADVAALSAVQGAAQGDRAYVASAKSEAVYDGAAWVGHNDDWLTPTLLLGWVACSETGSTTGTVYPPQYRLKDGVARIKGFMKGGTSGTVFTIPASMRPAAPALHLTTASGGQARVDVNANGTIVPSSAYLNGGSNAFVSMNISYPPG